MKTVAWFVVMAAVALVLTAISYGLDHVGIAREWQLVACIGFFSGEISRMAVNAWVGAR